MDDVTSPIGVLQNCGAITTWVGNNPSYCVYEMDKETMLPISRKTYWFDMDLANATGTPQWNLMTDWTADFGMADLSPSSFKTMADQIENDEEFTTNFLN